MSYDEINITDYTDYIFTLHQPRFLKRYYSSCLASQDTINCSKIEIIFQLYFFSVHADLIKNTHYFFVDKSIKIDNR